MNSKEHINTKSTHAALCQLYQWYAFYERPMSNERLNNQMNILSSDLYMKSAAGELNGKSGYPERIENYQGWKNAHHIQKVNVKERNDGKIECSADIHYMHIQPNGEQNQYAIHYETILGYEGQDLPVFQEIVLNPIGVLNTEFQDVFVRNRCLRTMHYWLYCIECLEGEAELFAPVLDSSFSLNFATGMIQNLDQLSYWLKGAPASFKATNHHPRNALVKTLEENQYELKVDFEWYGVMKDGKKMKAITNHTWILKDKLEDDFARISQMDVEYELPFMVYE